MENYDITNEFNNGIRDWHGAILNIVSTASVYIEETRKIGIRLFGSRWSNAAAVVDASSVDPIKQCTDLQNYMDIVDTLGSISLLIDNALIVLLDRSIIRVATSRMSRTYSNNITIMVRNITDAVEVGRTSATVVQHLAVGAGTLIGAGMKISEIYDAYNNTTKTARGRISTELYVSAIVQHKGQKSKSILEGSKSLSLGGIADNILIATADTRLLRPYHPLQAMTYMPKIFEPTGGDVVPGTHLVDITIPQSHLTVVYDINPLINRASALKFGPLAPIVSGLNYRIVDRLRTQVVTPMDVRGTVNHRDPPAILSDIGFRVTMDNGVSEQILQSPGKWAPLAGCPPQVELYNTASSVVILENIREAHSRGWGVDVRARYDQAIIGERIPTGECSNDILIAAIVAEYEKAHAGTDIVDKKGFRKAVVGNKFRPDGYICAAVTRVGIDMMETRMRTQLMTSDASARVPHNFFNREMIATQYVTAISSSRVLWAHIRTAYMSDHEIFLLPSGRKKPALTKLVRKIVTIAVESAQITCSPPSLKEFSVSSQIM